MKITPPSDTKIEFENVAEAVRYLAFWLNPPGSLGEKVQKEFIDIFNAEKHDVLNQAARRAAKLAIEYLGQN